MKKKYSYILILSLFLCISLIGCNNEKNEDINSNKQKQEQGKNDVQKKTEDKKVDEDMVKFSSSYTEIYNQEDNAFIELSFKDKDFIPKELFEKSKLIKIEEDDKKELQGYKIFISCEDNVLFRISYDKYQQIQNKSLDNFYMSKGEFFIIELRDDEDLLISVNAYKNPDWYAYSNIYIDEDIQELIEKGEVLQDVFFWQKEDKASVFAKTPTDFTDNNTIYKKTASVDLDGDNKEERIYFWGEAEHFIYDDENAKPIPKKLIIDDNEIPLDILSKENNIEDIEDFYEKDFDGIEIIDIDPEDKYKEIFLIKSMYGPSTFLGKFYHYEDDTMKYLGTIEYFGDKNDILSGLYDKKLRVKNLGYIGFNYIFDNIYKLEGDKLVKQENDSVNINSFYKKIVAYLNKELNLYEKIDSKEPMEKLKIGDQLIFLETDSLSWIKVKSANTGKIGYIKFSKGEEEYKLYFQDQEELKNLDWIDIFDKLPMWG